MSNAASNRLSALAATAMLLFASGCASVNAKMPGSPAEWRAEMQPPLSEEQAQQVAQGLDLADAVRLGYERNPGVQAARNRWFAAIHVEPQAVTPPDPMLQFGYPFQKMISLMGRQRWSGGIMQQFPWPQKLWARGRIAAADADIAELRYDAVLRDLIIDVKDSYYELFYLDQAIPVTERIEAMLRNDAILAYSELTVGRAQINEAFRAESQATQLAYDRILLVEQRAAQAERIKALLNLPPATAVGPIRTAPTYRVSESIDDLYSRAEAYAEVLKMRGVETQKAAYEAFLAKLSQIPDLGLGLDILHLTKTTAMPGSGGSSTTPSVAMTAAGGSGTAGGGTTTAAPSAPTKTSIGNNMNMLAGAISMNLLIYEWRNRAVIEENKALEQAMRLDALDETNQVRAAVAQTYFHVCLTDRLMRLYADTLVPQAEHVMGQSEILFRNDQASFSNLIETTLAYHNFTLAHLRAVADHGQAIGRLEMVLGTTADPRTDDNGLQPVVSESSKQKGNGLQPIVSGPQP